MAQDLVKEFFELGRILAKFQAIDLTLKIFIARNKYETDTSKDILLKNYSTLELDRYSLGMSLDGIKKFNLINNEELLIQLTSLKNHRNFVAHKGFLMVSNLPDSDKEFFLGSETNTLDYQELNDKLDELIELLTKEYYKTYSIT